MKRTLISLSVAALFGSGTAQAMGPVTVNTTGNNFTMVSASNGLTGGNNDTVFTWDGTWKNAVVTDGSYNATLSSVTAFSGAKWTAHHVNIYGPGTYIFYTGCPSGGVASTTYNPSCGTGATYNLTVGAGQVGAHMLFNWKTNTDIDVVVLWDMNKSWAATGTASAFQAGGTNTVDTVWSGVSIDTAMDPDNYSGTKMVDGPFVGQSANFNVNGVSAQGTTVTYVTVNSGGTLGTSAVVPSSSLGTPPAGITMDDGLSYTITGAAATANVKLTFPGGIAGKTMYKVNAGTFTVIPEASFTREADGFSITMDIVDNGIYDANAVAGTISDPIAPGAGTAAALTLGSAPGGGGCTFNLNGKFDPAMIIMLLGGLGYLGWQHKRRD